MKLLFLTVAMFASTCLADVLPTITQNVTYSGNGFASAGYSLSIDTNGGFNAAIIGSAKTFPGFPGGDSMASADFTLQAAFVATGSGQGFVVYNGSPSLGGNSGSFSGGYQIAGVGGGCGAAGCGGLGGLEVMVPITLGVPFSLELMGSASAYSGPNAEDAAYNIPIHFFATDAHGTDIALSEVPLPTPEPSTFLFTCLAAASVPLFWKRKVRRAAKMAA